MWPVSAEQETIKLHTNKRITSSYTCQRVKYAQDSLGERKTGVHTCAHKKAAPRGRRDGAAGRRRRASPATREGPRGKSPGAPLGRMPAAGQRRPALPRAFPAVPSALGGLTSGFGMGPGVPPLPWPLTNKGHSVQRGRAWPCPQGRTA